MEFYVNIKPDEEGYLGRECPSCEKYFKIKHGTGIPDFVGYYCPYCKHFGPQDEFCTKQQIKYVQSVALNKISDDLLKTMRKMERKPKRNQFISIVVTVKGKPTPITHYTEKELEEKVTCTNCTLEYTIYGTFGFCPDCSIHNSKQIVRTNFDLALKMVKLAESAEDAIKDKLIENALEDCISAFDGFAREHCSQLYTKQSFQNILIAHEKLNRDHRIDISDGLLKSHWDFVVTQFQKRHLLAHKMGIIDDDFIKKTNGDGNTIGRKVSIKESDIVELVKYLDIVVDNIAKSVRRS